MKIKKEKIKEEWFHRIKENSQLIIIRKGMLKMEEVHKLLELLRTDDVIVLDDGFRFIEIEHGAKVTVR